MIEMSDKLNAEWVTSHGDLPWLRLDLHGPFEAMLSEARKLRPMFLNRCMRQDNVKYQYPDYGKGWSALCLRAIDENKIGHFSQYGYQSEDEVPYQWTSHAKKCPVTVEFINSFPARKIYRVRFLLLGAGGSIEEHVDTSYRCMERISIALSFPEGCLFEMQGKPVPFEPGSVFLLDRSRMHRVENHSKEDRIHLVIEANTQDVPEWDKLVVDAYKCRRQ